METKYKVTIEKMVPYMVTGSRIDAEDGKTYASYYSVPNGVKYKTVKYETGEIGSNKTVEYTQEVAQLNLVNVIKAINSIE